MWILTQNGKRILSTEGVEEIKVADPILGKELKTDYAVMMKKKSDGKAFALGFYHNKDKAVSVVRMIYTVQSEITASSSSTEVLKPSYEEVQPKVFQMPQDEILELLEK